MLPTANSTKMPPWGARTADVERLERPPVTALPSMIAGMTRSGSAAANGIAPSVMKLEPSSHAALPFSRSAWVNSRGSDDGGERERDRRHHSGQHDRSHDLAAGGVPAARAPRLPRRRRRSV